MIGAKRTMKIVPKIKTERVVLRGIIELDTDFIVAWRGNPNVYPYFRFPHVLTKKEHLQWFYSRYCLDYNRYDWMAIEKQTEKPIGLFGLHKNQEEPEEIEINYLLAEEAQGKGYAKEVVEELIKWAKKQWNAKMIFAEIHCKNNASLNFIEKMKFTKDRAVGEFFIYKRVV